MKSSIAALALIFAGAFTAYGQTNGPTEIPDFEVRPAVVIGPDDTAKVDGKHDWKGWLEKTFPDDSAAWPKEASVAFGAAAGNEKWDHIGKGDFDRDGSPTAVLVRVERISKTGRVVVKALKVLKWQGGRWSELLGMGGGVRMNGTLLKSLSQPRFYAYTISFFIGDPKEAAHPGAHVSMNVVNREGRELAEPIHFAYLPDQKKYASAEGDGDYETK